MESNIKEIETENQDAISYLSFNSLKEDLENAIDELPEQRQKIFRLSRFEQLKHKEIAIKLNISPKTVETQIYRSLANNTQMTCANFFVTNDTGLFYRSFRSCTFARCHC
jgi:RNA polymerase sigma-70 factor (ECF subfamily)